MNYTDLIFIPNLSQAPASPTLGKVSVRQLSYARNRCGECAYSFTFCQEQIQFFRNVEKPLLKWQCNQIMSAFNSASQDPCIVNVAQTRHIASELTIRQVLEVKRALQPS